MPLLGRCRGIVVQNLIDNPGEPVELRPRRRSAPPIAWRHRKAHHLGHGAWVDPKISGRTTLAQPLHINCSPNPRIQIHALHPSAFRPDTGRKAYLDDALLRRRGRTIRPLHVRDFCAAAYTSAANQPVPRTSEVESRLASRSSGGTSGVATS